MTRVAALSSVLGEPVSRTLIRRALADQTAAASSPPTPAARAEAPSVSTIQEAVCSVLEVPRSAMLSTNRTAAVSHARQIAMYLARDLTDLSLAEIAREFRRDHTTILHATRAVSARASADAGVSDTIHRVRELLAAELPVERRRVHQRSVHAHPSSTNQTSQVKP